MSTVASSQSFCSECGARVAGLDACQGLFDEILAREFSDFRYGQLHRLTVDAYSLQHPQRYMRSGKSYAAHLTGIYAALERNDTREVNQSVQRWLSGDREIVKPGEAPPLRRGKLTIVHVHRAADPEDHLRRVRQWARSIWADWRTYEADARLWIEEALAEAGPASQMGGAHRGTKGKR